MTPLPITLLFFTSTKGHFGHRDVYLKTLAHLDRQLPLSTFGGKIAHIKVTPGEETFGTEMAANLRSRGFEVITTVADWSRGQSHQAAYMADVVTVSQHPDICKQPFVLWLEDDTTITPHQISAEDLLLQSCKKLADDNELVSVRLLRRCDYSTSPMLDQPAEGDRWFFSPHVNFQPLLLRSRDFYLAANVVQQQPQAAATYQCEMLWRLVLANFSRSDRKHLVYLPDYAETIHLGVPDYPQLCQQLSL